MPKWFKRNLFPKTAPEDARTVILEYFQLGVGNSMTSRPSLIPGSRLVGVPAGGTTGQFFRKTSDKDYEGDWSDVDGIPVNGTHHVRIHPNGQHDQDMSLTEALLKYNGAYSLSNEGETEAARVYLWLEPGIHIIKMDQINNFSCRLPIRIAGALTGEQTVNPDYTQTTIRSSTDDVFFFHGLSHAGCDINSVTMDLDVYFHDCSDLRFQEMLSTAPVLFTRTLQFVSSRITFNGDFYLGGQCLSMNTYLQCQVFDLDENWSETGVESYLINYGSTFLVNDYAEATRTTMPVNSPIAGLGNSYVDVKQFGTLSAPAGNTLPIITLWEDGWGGNRGLVRVNPSVLGNFTNVFNITADKSIDDNLNMAFVSP